MPPLHSFLNVAKLARFVDTEGLDSCGEILEGEVAERAAMGVAWSWLWAEDDLLAAKNTVSLYVIEVLE